MGNIVRLKAAHRDQRGFTLVEMVMAFGVAVVVIGAASISLLQAFNMNTRNTNYMTAVRNVQTAGYWVTHDTAMAQAAVTDGDTFLYLTWTDNLMVTHTDNLTWDAATKVFWRSLDGQQTRVTEHIADVNFSYDNVTRKLTFTVTATVTTRSITGTETRKYEVTQRPGAGGP